MRSLVVLFLCKCCALNLILMIPFNKHSPFIYLLNIMIYNHGDPWIPRTFFNALHHALEHNVLVISYFLGLILTCILELNDASQTPTSYIV